MNKKSRICPIILLLVATQLFVVHSVIAQNEDIIVSGIVISYPEGEPVELAEVFISGTTIGTITDKNGHFNLKVPFIPCTLVADHVSYESNINILDGKTKYFEISLIPYVKSVDEIEVRGKNNRKKNLRFFYSRFIKENSKKIKILNDSVLYFRRSDDEFIAYSKEPLIIVNDILGYKIKLILKQLIIRRYEYPNGPPLALNSYLGMEFIQISGYYFYEAINSPSLNKQAIYEKNRRTYYFGSDRHFLKAIYNNDFKSKGFQLTTYPKNQDRKGFVEVKNNLDNTNNKYFLMDCDSIYAHFWFDKNRYPVNLEADPNWKLANSELTKIYRSNKIFKIRKNGTSPDVDFIVIGPMSASENLANSIPQDYMPD